MFQIGILFIIYICFIFSDFFLSQHFCCLSDIFFVYWIRAHNLQLSIKSICRQRQQFYFMNVVYKCYAEIELNSVNLVNLQIKAKQQTNFRIWHLLLREMHTSTQNIWTQNSPDFGTWNLKWDFFSIGYNHEKAQYKISRSKCSFW